MIKMFKEMTKKEVAFFTGSILFMILQFVQLHEILKDKSLLFFNRNCFILFYPNKQWYFIM